MNEQQGQQHYVYLRNEDSGAEWAVAMPSAEAAVAVAMVLADQDPDWFHTSARVTDSLETLIDYVVEWSDGNEIYEAGLRAQIEAAIQQQGQPASESNGADR